MDFSSADLDALLMHGVPVTLAGDPMTMGSFRVADVEVQVEEGVTVTATHPTVLVRNDRLPSAARHLSINVNGTTYVIRDIRRESNGQFKRLILVENDA